MNTSTLPDNPVFLKQILANVTTDHEEILADKDAVIADQAATIVDREATISDHKAEISRLAEQVRLLKAIRFQAQSEKNRFHGHEVQYPLFNEAEMVADEAGEDDDKDIQVPAHTRKKRGRRPISPDYPRVEVIHDIPEDEKVCPCGCELTRIGEEVSEKLDIIPQKIQVIRHIRPKYACRACEGVEDDGPTVKIAPMPPQIIPQGIVTPSLLAYILINKFADGLPFYRQSTMFDRLGVDISRATMSGWAIRAGRAVEPLIELLHQEIRSGPIINMDETPVQVLKEPGRENTTKSYMWVARGGPPGKPVVLFHYAPSRGGEVAKELVGGFKGYLQTDGYVGYNALGKRPDIIHVGCLAHVRRKFHDVIKAAGKKNIKKKGGTAQTVLDLIGKVYKKEKQARRKESTPDEILAMRKNEIKPLLDKIKNILIDRKATTPPKSLLGQAIFYALGQWPRIEVYLNHPGLTPDNNVAENAIRPFAVGRKNWLFAGSPKGAKASAAIYSLIESAKANGLNPHQYLTDLFDKLPPASSEQDLRALLPQNIASMSSPG